MSSTSQAAANTAIQGLVCVSKTAYQVSPSDAGTMVVQSANLDGNFTTKNVGKACPSNRTNSCILELSPTSFLLIGGDGIGIMTNEIWKFDTSANTWQQISVIGDTLKRRNSHAAALNQHDNIIYIFGGNNSLDACSDLAVLCLNGDTVECHTVHVQPDVKWPIPRINHTLTSGANKICLFGGQNEDGFCLSDLWELDYSLFPLKPVWHQICKNGPLPRHSHCAWFQGNNFFIAGGIGDDGSLYNDIWRFDGEWQQTMIFETQYPIFACRLGLCEVSRELKLVKQRSPYAALDGLFEQLRQRQAEYTEKASYERQRGSAIEAEKANLAILCQALKEYNEGQEKTPEIQKAIDAYSPAAQEDLRKQLSEQRNALAKLTSEIADEYSKYISNKHPDVSAKSRELALQLTLMLTQAKSDFERKKAEKQAEITLYKEQLNLLKKELPSGFEPPNLDPANYSTFQDYISTLPKATQEFALTHYYGMQLRTYQHLLIKTQNYQVKIKKVSHEQTLQQLDKQVSRLSEKLSEVYSQVASEEDELARWKKALVEAKSDRDRAQEILKAIKPTGAGQSTLDQRVKDLEARNAALIESLKEQLRQIVTTQKQPIDDLYTMVSELNDKIAPMTPNDARFEIEKAMPGIRSRVAKITAADKGA